MERVERSEKNVLRAEIDLARRFISIDGEQLLVLQALAAANGFDNVWSWAEDECRPTTRDMTLADWITEYVLYEWDPIEVAQHIMIDASPDGSSPWGDTFPGPETWTKERYWAAVDEYLIPDPRYPIPTFELDRVDLRAAAEAAFRHDGATARRHAKAVARRWGLDDNGRPIAWQEEDRASAVG